MILLLFLSACAGRREGYPERLQRASQLVEACPDSALGYLDSLGVPLSGLSEEARMYAGLLRIKAYDKLYVPHTSDSAINRIVEFYEGFGDRERLAEAYFYQGSVYRDLQDAPRAIAALQRAADQKSKNDTLNGRIYGQLASLFAYQGAYGENIAMGGFGSSDAAAENVTEEWMNSDGHRANILKSSYTTIGVGCFRIGNVSYWVELFGTARKSETYANAGVGTATTKVDYSHSLVPYDGSGFNLNMRQEDPEPLEPGETYELVVGIQNPEFTYFYTSTEAHGYTWKSRRPFLVEGVYRQVQCGVGYGRAAKQDVAFAGYGRHGCADRDGVSE